MSFAFAQNEEAVQGVESGSALQEAIQGAAGSQEFREAAQNIQTFASVFQIISGFLVLIGFMKIFKKAGIPQWKTLIPVYNFYLVCGVARISGWHTLLLFVPLFNLISVFKIARGLSRAFGKGGGFTAGIFFLPFIFVPVLGFSKEALILDEDN